MGQTAERLRDPALAALNGVPLHLTAWIARSMSGDMGSVGNKEVFRHSDFIFMIVKGPNRRNDFHIDPYDEIFYQLKGTIYVKHRDAAGHTQVAEVKEGEVMIINAFTPHLPIRPRRRSASSSSVTRVVENRTASSGTVTPAVRSCIN